jgi:hypothetical protein
VKIEKIVSLYWIFQTFTVFISQKSTLVLDLNDYRVFLRGDLWSITFPSLSGPDKK